MIIAVTSRRDCRGDFWEQLEKIAAAGPGKLILREKELSEAEYYALAGQCLEICRRHDMPLAVNTFRASARRLGITRIQLTFGDFIRYRGELGDFSERGVSVHSTAEAAAAARAGASYLIVGHIFATDCKKGVEPRGLAFLRDVCRSVELPVYAIGGATPDNFPLITASGAAGACLMSSLMRCADPAALLARFTSPA